MRLNGWQRLWVVGSALWIAAVAGWAHHEHRQIAGRYLAQLERWIDVDREILRVARSVQQPPDVRSAVGAALLVPALAYGAGLMVVWVWRGFRPTSS